MASERLGWGGGDLQGGSQFAKKTSVSEGSEGVFESLFSRFGVSGGDRGVIFFSRRMFANVTAIVGRHVR